MEKYIDKIQEGNQEYNIEGSARVGSNNSDKDFVISDDKGNVIVDISGGNIKTKNFDSRFIPSTNTDNADFEVSDERGNTITRFKNGSFETKVIKNFKLDVELENGSIDGSGMDAYDYYSYFNSLRSAFFVNVEGCTQLFVEKSCYVFKYNINHIFIGLLFCGENQAVDITNCNYIRLMYRGDNNKLACGFNGTIAPKQEKRVQQRTPSERLLFHVDGEMFTAALLMLPSNYTTTGKKVPLILWDSGDGSYMNWNTYQMGAGYEKRRIGLEYMRDQGFAVLEIYSWGSYYYNKHYGCGGRSAMPIPTHLKTHQKGVEYVCSRFNVDIENVFELSKSGSGKLSLYYALYKPSFGLKHIYAMAPVFDDLNFLHWEMTNGYSDALYEELKLTGTEDQISQFLNGTPVAKGGNGTGWKFGGKPSQESGLSPDDPIFVANIQSNQDFIRNNADKFSLASVNWINLTGQTIDQKVQDTFDFGEVFWAAVAQGTQGSNTTGENCYTRYNLMMKGGEVPIDVIMAKNDEQTPYWNCLEVVKQIQNGGREATITTLNSGGHSAPDMGSGDNLVSDLTTMLGVTYEEVSIGWYLACKDIQTRYLSHVDSEVAKYVSNAY